MITIDARTLREPQPTGVTELARQFISHTKQLFPDSALFTGEDVLSNRLTNLSLLTHVTTIERCAGVYNTPTVVFLPNTHFVHTEPTNPRVHVVHDLSFAHTPSWYSPRMRMWHTLTQATGLINEADVIITVSDRTRSDVINHCNIDESRVHVVNPYTPLSQSGTRPQHSFTQKPFFLFLGTLEKRKNVSGVIEAFLKICDTPQLRDHQLVLAGKPGHGAPYIQHDRIHFMSYVTNPEKWWLLKHAVALVYPSFFEGFGVQTLEAASVGCPTIISDCTAMSDTMGNASAHVSPYDVAQIALAMEAVATNRSFASTLKVRGFERAAWYSMKRQKDALHAVLSHALTLV